MPFSRQGEIDKHDAIFHDNSDDQNASYRGNQAVMLGGVGQHLVKAMDLRQGRGSAAIQKWRNPRVEAARHSAPLRG